METVTAVGTLAAAIVAVIGLLISIKQNAKNLAASSEVAREDRLAADRRAEEDRRLIIVRQERDRHLDLLHDAAELIALAEAYGGAPQASEANAKLRVVLALLPDDEAILARGRIGNIDPSIIDAQLASLGKPLLAEQSGNQVRAIDQIDDIARDIANLVLRSV